MNKRKSAFERTEGGKTVRVGCLWWLLGIQNTSLCDTLDDCHVMMFVDTLKDFSNAC